MAVVQYTFTHKQYTEQHNRHKTVYRTTKLIYRTTQVSKSEGRARLCEVYPGICLTSEEKARKNLSQGMNSESNHLLARIRIKGFITPVLNTPIRRGA